MYNPNWPRWIYASCTKFFDAGRDGLKLYFEGTDKGTRRSDADYAEFRMTGPVAREISRGYWEILFEINVIVFSTKDGKDAHKIFKNLGKVATIFAEPVPIFKYGDGEADDSEYLECAILQGGIIVEHYGQFDPELQILEAGVEGEYKLILSVEE